MKKTYFTPDVKVIEVSSNDIICTSPVIEGVDNQTPYIPFDWGN